MTTIQKALDQAIFLGQISIGVGAEQDTFFVAELQTERFAKEESLSEEGQKFWKAQQEAKQEAQP
jgi:hypothetical protein